MTEVVIDTDAGKKRRLPTWMLQKKSADELRSSGNGDGTSSKIGEQLEAQGAGLKTKRGVGKRSRGVLTEDTDGSDRPEILQRCEANKRHSKTSRRDVGPGNSIVSCGEAKSKTKRKINGGERTVDEVVARKKRNLKIRRPKDGNFEVQSPGRSEDEIELTVEDLVGIAEEYLNADGENQHECSTSREFQSDAHPLSSVVSPKADAGEPLQVARTNKTLSRCTTTTSSSHSTLAERNEKYSPPAENFARNIIKTGDAAQDMLDLLLGPLLKKPGAEEQELGAIERESLTLTQEMNKQVQSRGTHGGEAPVTKKKSSLKDKVAIFFD